MLGPNRVYRKESAAALSRHFLSRARPCLICLGLLGALAPFSYATAQWWDSQAETLRVANRLALLPDLRDTDAVGRVLGTAFDAKELPPVPGLAFPLLTPQPSNIRQYELTARDPTIRSHVTFSMFTRGHWLNRVTADATIVLRKISARPCLTRPAMNSLVSGVLRGLPTDGDTYFRYVYHHDSNNLMLDPVVLDYSLAQPGALCFQEVSLEQHDL
jgi:hypothetical protein